MILTILRSIIIVLPILFAASTTPDAGLARRSLEIPATRAVVSGDLSPAAIPHLRPDLLQQLLQRPRPCFVFVHDVAKASGDPYDQRHYVLELTTMLDDLLGKWRFDKIGGCKSVLFTMLTTDKTYYGELAEIDLVDLQSVDNRSFDARDANLARSAEIVLLKDLYRRIRFVGREPGAPIYAALFKFLEAGYYGVVKDRGCEADKSVDTRPCDLTLPTTHSSP